MYAAGVLARNKKIPGRSGQNSGLGSKNGSAEMVKTGVGAGRLPKWQAADGPGGPPVGGTPLQADLQMTGATRSGAAVPARCGCLPLRRVFALLNGRSASARGGVTIFPGSAWTPVLMPPQVPPVPLPAVLLPLVRIPPVGAPAARPEKWSHPRATRRSAFRDRSLSR